jgi:hypothetical protein
MLNCKNEFIRSFAKDIIIGWQQSNPIDNVLMIVAGTNAQKLYFEDLGFIVHLYKKNQIIGSIEQSDNFVNRIIELNKSNEIRLVGILNKEVVFANHTAYNEELIKQKQKLLKQEKRTKQKKEQDKKDLDKLMQL